MPDLHDRYEQKLRGTIRRNAKRILRAYERAIVEVVLQAKLVKYQGKVFRIDKYPTLQRQVEAAMKKLHGSLYAGVLNGIETSWGLSNEKNDILVDRRIANGKLKDKKLPPKLQQILYDPNAGALEAFKKRKDAGIDLSDRVWKTLEPFRNELELSLGAGISEGKSAAAMARDLKQHLVNPDKLFRRVRRDDGSLGLSKAAKNYHPGQGVYRSSYKNALRLSATETNIAYRSADHARWQTLPFIRGIRVSLSNNHPVYDICDRLAGLYPKDFVFTGWHPFCRCFATPEQVSDAEYEKIEDQLLGLSDEEPTIDPITEPHADFAAYVEENRERIKGWKNKPYWVRQNKEYAKL
ncbi:hypothetical protein [Flaviaesturariibacter amylovorans]|uniref:Phage head morphogenesis domain-containing protein n=1 Tax=Flaviaesturariibacter amylovorans TaxID=1084520 RepID=A0ABP8GQG4_9BACT